MFREIQTLARVEFGGRGPIAKLLSRRRWKPTARVGKHPKRNRRIESARPAKTNLPTPKRQNPERPDRHVFVSEFVLRSLPTNQRRVSARERQRWPILTPSYSANCANRRITPHGYSNICRTSRVSSKHRVQRPRPEQTDQPRDTSRHVVALSKRALFATDVADFSSQCHRTALNATRSVFTRPTASTVARSRCAEQSSARNRIQRLVTRRERGSPARRNVPTRIGTRRHIRSRGAEYASRFIASNFVRQTLTVTPIASRRPDAAVPPQSPWRCERNATRQHHRGPKSADSSATPPAPGESMPRNARDRRSVAVVSRNLADTRARTCGRQAPICILAGCVIPHTGNKFHRSSSEVSTRRSSSDNTR